VYDEANNRRRVEISYTSYNLPDAVALPTEVKEYAANGTTVLRRTTTTYYSEGGDQQVYIDRRVLGLLREVIVYDANNQPQSKVWYDYDWDTAEFWAPTSQPATQHDASGGARGRGNLVWIGRWDVSDVNNFDKHSRSYIKYNRTGSVIKTEDHFGHGKTISYTDTFSDGVTTRNTFAYPTTITDSDGGSSYVQYNYDIGATTRTESPAPAGQTQGTIYTMTYNGLGQLERMTTASNSAYKRYYYGPYFIQSFVTVNSITDDAYTNRIFDGLGRVTAVASNHPDSQGGYKAQLTVYDQMGRAVKTSNPAEITETWVPYGDDNAGWLYTQQSYDWQGRPRITTNTDTSTNEISYEGCGCAGSDIITTIDAVGRKTKSYRDVLGRESKAEILNTNGSVYATTVNDYNARDQILSSKQYVELATSDGSCPVNTCQQTTYTYDGHGRLSSRHLPEQASGTSTVYTYRPDDTLWTETDSRGATTTYTYNGRGLPTNISYSAPSGIAVPSATTIEYDAAGNRSSMTDSRGTVWYDYDQLSRLKHEKRYFSALPNAPVLSHKYTITYDYNLAGNLTSITDPFGDSFSYTRNAQGQLKTVSGSPYAGWTSYVTNVNYRAWGAPKGVSYGGGGGSSTIGFNLRMQPTSFAGGGMRENYSYYADGRLQTLTDLNDTAGNNPPVTLRFLSRSFNYDHVGRVTNGFGSGGGGQGVPFTQTYSYDAFGNMTGRTGSYYNYQTQASPTKTDTSTYVNNRRTNWGYNLEGQVTSTPLTSTDSPRTMAYDAAGRLVSSVETGPFNTTTYTPAYDGDDQVVYESSITSPGTSESSYIVRSSVLGGEVLTRLDQSGNKKITYVPAEGLLFATQRASGGPGPLVLLTYRNPLGISETTKAVYDPLGNYIPFVAHGDPRPPAGSYSSASMSGLSSSQASAESYGVGCIADGIPTNCKKVMEHIERGRAEELDILGPAIAPFVTKLMMSLTPVGAEFRSSNTGSKPIAHGESSDGNGWTISFGSAELWIYYLLAPGLQRGFEQNPTKPQQSSKPVPLQSTNELRDEFKKLLETPKCKTFIDSLISLAESHVQQSLRLGLGFEDLFENISGQGGYVLVDHLNLNGYPVSGLVDRNTTSIEQGNAQAMIRTRSYYTSDPVRVQARSFAAQRRMYLASALHETFHHIGKVYSAFSDESLGRAAFALTGDKALLPNDKDTDPLNWSSYWDNQLMKHCMPDLVRSGNIPN
jgi:YD repeat-containing protein